MDLLLAVLCTGLDPEQRSHVHDQLHAAPPRHESGSAAEQYLRQLASGRGGTAATMGGGDT